MSEWLGSYGPLTAAIVIIVIAVGFIRWRLWQFDSLDFDQAEMDEMADAVLTDLRAYCSGPREPIGVPRSYWRDIPWTNDKLLYLLRYMTGRGWITLPGYDWRVQRVLRTELPTSVALTQSSYDEYTAARTQAPPVVVNGPAHFGVGDQIFSGDVEFNWQEIERRVDDLVLDIHRTIPSCEGEIAARLEEIATILSGANDRKAYGEPAVRPALRWLAGFATDASAGAVGAGIAAAATAILGLLAS